MPEIAEVETFKRQLEPYILHSCIEQFNVHNQRSVRRQSAHELQALVVGQEVVKIIRHGKYMSFELKNHTYLNVHLRMSGRFLMFNRKEYNPSNNPKHSHIEIVFDDYVVVFIDPRTFGEMWVTEDIAAEMKRGIDALQTSHDQRVVSLRDYSSSKRPIKSILLDQNIISGIGNIYADEICADAMLSPHRRLADMSDEDIENICKSMKQVLNMAVELRGSSLRDESFKDLYGNIGQYQTKHCVHGRASCARCSGLTVKSKVVGRTTYECRLCQR